MLERKFISISLKNIHLPSHLVRTSSTLDEDFTNFTEQRGILQPIGVRELSPGYFELVWGYRRYLGAEKVGLQEIPAMVVDVSEREALGLTLAENSMREDPNPMDIARHAEFLKNDFGYTQVEIAALLDKSKSLGLQSFESIPRSVSPGTS